MLVINFLKMVERHDLIGLRSHKNKRTGNSRYRIVEVKLRNLEAHFLADIRFQIAQEEVNQYLRGSHPVVDRFAYHLLKVDEWAVQHSKADRQSQGGLFTEIVHYGDGSHRSPPKDCLFVLKMIANVC